MSLAAKALLILALGLGPRPPDYRGDVVRYAAGRMDHTADVRGIPRASHMAAWTAATDRDIGRTWLHIAGPAGAADFLVVDLPRPGKDKEGLEARGVIAEVDYYSGFGICGAHWSGRARDCEVRVWVIPE